MKSTIRTIATSVGAVAVSAVALLSTAGPALASAPPYEPDSTDQIGQLTFYDASGDPVTSGAASDAPFANYAVATADDPQTANTTATLYGYLPKSGQLPANWSGEQLSGTTTFPVVGGPGPVGSAGTHRPVVTMTADDLTLHDLATDYPNTAASGDPYEGLYQLRLVTPGNTKYWAADVMISGSTWTQVYPSGAPAPSGTAALTGKHEVGTTDHCVPSFSNATSYAYKWFASGTKITGATSSSYKISEKYYGKTLACKITATGPGGTGAATSAGHKVLAGAALVPTKKPFVFHGSNRTTAKKGTAEKVNHGTWSPLATSYTYQWFIGSHKIAHATKGSYTPKASDVGKKLSCRVTAHRHGWTNGVKKTAGVTVKS